MSLAANTPGRLVPSGSVPRRPGRMTGAPRGGYPRTVNDLVMSALELLPA
ncbi:MAG: hypothetical protein K0S88_977 [Actinomycetia bacterium]|jgi:hypothetical protein|nr:hypothetical protein [Actinomycetes bacterium]